MEGIRSGFAENMRTVGNNSLSLLRSVDFRRADGKNMKSWPSADTTAPLDFGGPIDDTFDRFDDSWIERPIMERFEEIAVRYATRPAVGDSSNTWTYAELRRWAYRLAEGVTNVAAGRPVGILLPHDARMPVAALACLAAGCPYVPIDLKYPAARIDAIVREAGLAAVILEAASDAARLVPAEMALIDIGVAPPLADEPFTPVASVQSLAVILYTSGSTGKPKGICNNQPAILQRVAEYTNSCHVNADDRFILLSSPGTIAGQRETFTALLNGATLHVTDPQQDGIHSVLRTIGERHITIGYAVPSLLRMLLRLPGAKESFSHLRVLRVGGDVTLDSDLALFRKIAPPSCHFFASFSSTETPAVFQWFVPPEWEISGPRVPIGNPRPGVDFKVIGEDEEPVPDGEIGELVVRSRYLALGQWQEGRLRSGPFLSDPDDPSMRIFRTGDMVKLRADGLWELIGRKDRQVKVRGLRIDVGEVEAALRSCDSVTDVAVIGRRSGEEVTALAAFVVPVDSRREALLHELKSVLNARIPAYMHPADIVVIDRIPQLPGFKPDLGALERLDRQESERRAAKQLADNIADNKDAFGRGQRGSVRSDIPPYIRDAVEYAWTAVLGAKSFEQNRPWNETDGDSLKAIELWFYIEVKLGFKLPLDALDENTTPSGLVAAIADHLRRVDTGGNTDRSQAPVVFLMPGILSDDPALTRFRASLGNNVRFKTLDYPGWRQMVAAGGGFDAIVDAVFAKICTAPVCDVYRLAGYSFGGLVAFEVAHRLVASGRRVDFLGLLDARRWDLMSSDLARSFHTFLGEQPSLLLDPVKWMIAVLVRQRRFALLSSLERLVMLRPSKLSFWFKRQVTKEFRYRALREWKPAAIDVPTTFFMSDEKWPGEPDNSGWSDVCSRLVKVHIGGTHASVLQRHESLCARFLQALGISGARLDRC